LKGQYRVAQGKDGAAVEAIWEKHQAHKQGEHRAKFIQRLNEVLQGVQASGDIDDIMTAMSGDIRALFGCDRLTLYTVNPCRTSIRSRIKIGMDNFKDFALPISTSSIAGFVALHKRLFNITDVYDTEELRSYSRELHFLDAVDKRTGYRTREMVAAPIINVRNGELLGVLQLINNRLGGRFQPLVEEGVQTLCRVLGAVFEERLSEPVEITTRFDPLIVLGHLAGAELELAKRSARRKQASLEDLLMDEFQVGLDKLGASYAHFFGVPYEAFNPGRLMPALQQSIGRDYAEHNGWVVVEEGGNTLVVAATDPDRLRASRGVENLFPAHHVELRVTTDREFRQFVSSYYGSNGTDGAIAVSSPQTAEALAQRVQQLIAEALARAAPEVQAVLRHEGLRIERGEARLTLNIDIRLP
jgi:hypothetical protein